jgi:hypothetical protein
MKKIGVVLSLLALCVGTKAQTWISDSVNCGATIVNDVYYSLDAGTKRVEPASNWIIALETHSQTAGVLANGARGVRVFNIHKPASAWSSVALADTTTAALQYNSEYTWERGAFNVNRKTTDTFDYGWGKYDMASHNVYGDSIYIINQGTNFYKVIIDSLIGDSAKWHLRVGGVGGPIPTISYVFNKGTKYDTSNFIYVNAGMTGLTDAVREPDMNSWDIVFHKYMSYVTAPQGSGFYPVTGAFSNYKTENVRVAGVSLNDAFTNANSYPLNTIINQIGYDWKIIGGPNPAIFPDSLSFLVKSKQNKLYQIKFTGYSSATGDIKFNKRTIAPLSIVNQNNNFKVGVSPNPATNAFLLALEANQTTDAQLSIVNMAGQIVLQQALKINTGLNAWDVNTINFNAGVYFVKINGKNFTHTTSLIKQ